MRAWWRLADIVLAGCLSVSIATTAANAAEINVVSTGSVQELLTALAPAFERASGHTLMVRVEAGSAIVSKIKAGEDADLVVAGADTIDELVKAGKVAAEDRLDVLLSGVGV